MSSRSIALPSLIFWLFVFCFLKTKLLCFVEIKFMSEINFHFCFDVDPPIKLCDIGAFHGHGELNVLFFLFLHLVARGCPLTPKWAKVALAGNPFDRPKQPIN